MLSLSLSLSLSMFGHQFVFFEESTVTSPPMIFLLCLIMWPYNWGNTATEKFDVNDTQQVKIYITRLQVETDMHFR